MSRAVLRRRGVEPAQSCPAQVAEPGLVLCFRHRSGFTTLAESSAAGQLPGKRRDSELEYRGAYGVLHFLDRRQFQSLQQRETGYWVRSVRITTQGGRTMDASAFTSSPLLRLPKSVAPKSTYLACLLVGAREHALPPHYIAWLEAVPVASLPLSPAHFDTPSELISRLIVALMLCVITWKIH